MKRKPLLFIAEWRDLRGLTQEQLAARVEEISGSPCSNVNISRWERQKANASVEVMGVLAEALRIEPADLFRDPNRPESRILELVSGMDEKTKEQAVRLIEALKAA